MHNNNKTSAGYRVSQNDCPTFFSLQDLSEAIILRHTVYMYECRREQNRRNSFPELNFIDGCVHVCVYVCCAYVNGCIRVI